MIVYHKIVLSFKEGALNTVTLKEHGDREVSLSRHIYEAFFRVNIL